MNGCFTWLFTPGDHRRLHRAQLISPTVLSRNSPLLTTVNIFATSFCRRTLTGWARSPSCKSASPPLTHLRLLGRHRPQSALGRFDFTLLRGRAPALIGWVATKPLSLFAATALSAHGTLTLPHYSSACFVHFWYQSSADYYYHRSHPSPTGTSSTRTSASARLGRSGVGAVTTTIQA